MAIEKEIWVDTILENFVPNNSFLSEGVDLSNLVEYNTINLAEAGLEPDVLINNVNYPIPTQSREDTPLQLLLNTFDTKSTVVRNIEEMESSYEKMKSVARGHKIALLRKISAFAANNWAPIKNTDKTPVLQASGALDPSGVKAVTFEDFLQLERRFRELDVDMNTIVSVLTPAHMANLQAQDLKLYKDILSSGKLFGFKLYSFNSNPYFNKETGLKLAYGAAVTANDFQASFVFCNTQVIKAQGDTEMFVRYKDPAERGDVIGFQQRFTALPFRQKHIGAIFSTN